MMYTLLQHQFYLPYDLHTYPSPNPPCSQTEPLSPLEANSLSLPSFGLWYPLFYFGSL